MLNKVMEFAGSSLGKKVIIGGLAVIGGAVGVCILNSNSDKKCDPTVTNDSLGNGIIDITGEVTDTAKTNESDSEEA